ncbi:MAG: UDP-N-acetylglucosamine 2-epimerase (hydrolyzing) [Alphaproteobacteria bacterium]|nr:UDP-N-acetylglucosamine 2-epimerase (hydrolyzing) [Alphaproteobacteria bacterium]
MTAARKVFVLTGKRGGFGAMKPMLRLLRDRANFHLQLVVTDQHVSDKFGRTIQEVEREFSVAAAVDMEQSDDSPKARAKALGVCLQRMTDTLTELKPDICVLYGDRGEVLATATAATILGIPIAHLQGGDVSGSLDEQMRHAVTKLSHLHFPSTQESANRILKMGEEDWRVHVVGDNHIDLIVAGDYAKPDEVEAELGLDLSKPVIVVLQHSETTQPSAAYSQMAETLKAVASTGHQAVVVHPCSDQGYEGILRAIDEFAPSPQFTVRVNLDAHLFWGLLSVASVMVGNSSAGLIETPTFRLPAINVGRRQIGRLCAENVIHAPHEEDAISKALSVALSDAAFLQQVKACRQPFGDGTAGIRIVELLGNIPLDQTLLVKRMTY